MTRNADSLVLTIDMAHWRAPNGWRVAAEGSRWHSARGDGGRRDIAGGLAVPVSGRSQRYPIIAVAVLFQLKSTRTSAPPRWLHARREIWISVTYRAPSRGSRIALGNRGKAAVYVV